MLVQEHDITASLRKLISNGGANNSCADDGDTVDVACGHDVIRGKSRANRGARSRQAGDSCNAAQEFASIRQSGISSFSGVRCSSRKPTSCR